MNEFTYKLPNVDAIEGVGETHTEAVEDYLKKLNIAVYEDYYRKKEAYLFSEREVYEDEK